MITLHYIDQICLRIPTFTVSSLTCHRFLITSVAVASKALCDAFCTNSHYARVGGLPPLELARLEIDFLAAIDWRLVVSAHCPYASAQVPTHFMYRWRTASTNDSPSALS